MPDPSVNLVKVAQSVGKTTNRNCSVCHFNGGGGTGVKHGDMDGSMISPSAELDVHMGRAGLNCSSYHAGKNHRILGASHGSMAEGSSHISCLDCHGETPHRKKLVNDHVSTVACETCHIPNFCDLSLLHHPYLRHSLPYREVKMDYWGKSNPFTLDKFWSYKRTEYRD